MITLEDPIEYLHRHKKSVVTQREIGTDTELSLIHIFFMLSAHYRSPLNFSADLMEASKNSLERILTAMDLSLIHILVVKCMMEQVIH